MYIYSYILLALSDINISDKVTEESLFSILSIKSAHLVVPNTRHTVHNYKYVAIAMSYACMYQC